MAKAPGILGVHLLDEARGPARVGTLTRDADGGIAFAVAESYFRDLARSILSLGWYDPDSEDGTRDRRPGGTRSACMARCRLVLGVPRASLAMGMLIFPAVWDWYFQWRERRRGFFTAWEANMLQLGLALTRAGTGWLRQHSELADRLRPIPGLITPTDIAAVQADWDGACDAFYRYGFARAGEIRRVARVHRDPFEPILPILEAESPLGEYRLIVQEIIHLMPDADRYQLAAAEWT